MSENNNILQRNGRAFLLRNGEMKDPYGMANFHPASNVNRLDLYLEDVAENSIILLNFRANRKGLYALQWFPTIFSGFETRKLSGEQGFRNFSRFWTLVPPQVTQWNANGKSPLSVETSVIQYSSDGLVGIFNSILELETTHNNYEELYNNNSVAYVYDDSEDKLNPKMSFFMVDKDTIGEEDVYSWVAIDDPKTLLHYVQFKQYNVFNITIQKGNLPKPDKLMSITEQATHFVLHALQDMQSRIIGIDADIGNYSDGHKNTIKGYIGVLDNEIENVVKVDISNLENRVDEIVDTDLVNIVGDIEDLQQNKANESDLLLLDGRVEQIEDVELPKKADLTYVNNELDKKVDKTTYNAKIGLIDNELNRLDDVKAEKSQVYSKDETYTKNEIINKIANDLLNYYTKSETYTREQTNNLISQIPKFRIHTIPTYDDLPTENIDLGAIYIILGGDNAGEEYIWLENENRWEMLGTLDVDLTDYYDKDDVDTILLDYAKTIDVPTDISDLGDVNNKWDTKVDKKEDYSLIKDSDIEKVEKLITDGDGDVFLADDGSYKEVVSGVQSDWNITDTANDGFIKNKPAIKTVATTGNYNDLTNKPDLTLKLDKDFTSLPNQATPLLTDVMVLNRGTIAQKTTLGALLALVGGTNSLVDALCWRGTCEAVPAEAAINALTWR